MGLYSLYCRGFCPNSAGTASGILFPETVSLPFTLHLLLCHAHALYSKLCPLCTVFSFHCIILCVHYHNLSTFSLSSASKDGYTLAVPSLYLRDPSNQCVSTAFCLASLKIRSLFPKNKKATHEQTNKKKEAGVHSTSFLFIVC